MYQKSYGPSRPAAGRAGRGVRSGRGSSSRTFVDPRPVKRGAIKQGHGIRKMPSIDFSLFVRKAIKVEETVPYNPKHRFADFAIHDKLKANVAARDYVHPTPIQDGVIPHILDGRDVIGVANTGTGKTAAFLLPLIHKAFKNKANRTLIMVPTRELANQIEVEFREFAHGSGLRSALCIGGSNMGKQIQAISAHPSFVIGTPGRLKDLVDRKILDLSTFNHVVLDEVDRMLDMGFIKDIKELIAILLPTRQSLFFSATMPREISDLAQKFLRDPIRVEIKSRATAENVDQDIVQLKPGEDKVERLHAMLLESGFEKVLIFGRTKHGAEKLANTLVRRGFRADSIHGNHTQSRRERALRDFREGKIAILVATDVAARGLDIPDVTHVINYELPENYEDYIHRIGRTGRGSKSGKALTFVG
jgi:superfamily II DNA/RNA helicase